MPIDDDAFNESGIAETTPDIEVSLPATALHITVSRIPEANGDYTTKVWFNRKVRRYYAIGLLHEAIAMCLDTGSEFVWCNDTPSVLEQEETEQDRDNAKEDDDGDDLNAIVVRR